MDMNIIKSCCLDKKLRWTNHIFSRIVQRGISLKDVTDALMSGEIIEHYPDDYPYPSCLVLGYAKNIVPLHIVCGSDGNELWLITAYYPDINIWEPDMKTRKENKQ